MPQDVRRSGRGVTWDDEAVADEALGDHAKTVVARKNAAAILALAFGDISENRTITAVVLRVTGPPITCPV